MYKWSEPLLLLENNQLALYLLFPITAHNHIPAQNTAKAIYFLKKIIIYAMNRLKLKISAPIILLLILTFHVMCNLSV